MALAIKSTRSAAASCCARVRFCCATGKVTAIDTNIWLGDAVKPYLDLKQKTCIVLSENYAGPDGLCMLFDGMKHNKNISLCVWLKWISLSQLYTVLADMGCEQYIAEGRITAEDTLAGRVLER